MFSVSCVLINVDLLHCLTSSKMFVHWFVADVSFSARADLKWLEMAHYGAADSVVKVTKVRNFWHLGSCWFSGFCFCFVFTFIFFHCWTSSCLPHSKPHLFWHSCPFLNCPIHKINPHQILLRYCAVYYLNILQ